MVVRKRSGSRQRRRQRTVSGEPSAETERAVDPNRDKILGVVIHRTDRLRTDLRLRHPFVRIHFIDLNTRSYLHKTDPYVEFSPSNSLLHAREGLSCLGTGQSFDSTIKPISRPTTFRASALIRTISMTIGRDLRRVSSIQTNYFFRSTIPSWEKMFIINEEFSHFTTVGQGNVYIFFEVSSASSDRNNRLSLLL